ncbi:MAG: SDR family oxidoreductase [Gammaproteobacteria bacterium]
MSTTNESIIISGTSSGIGLAMARLMLQQGFTVEGIDRQPNAALETESNYHHHLLDIAETAQLEDRLGSITRGIQLPLRALVNNAGIGRMGNLEQLSVKDMDLVMRSNFLGHAIVTKALLPIFKRQGQGDIIFTGSEAALRGARQGSIYCASKFAIRGFAQALRDECGKSGVRVSIINPGAVRTPFFDELQFEPGAEPVNASEAEDVAHLLLTILQARRGTVLDEISLSPQSQVWQRKGGN